MLARGAEAIIIKDGNDLVKERVAKGYRLPEIDAMLRKGRTRLESRLLTEARRAGAVTPLLRDVKDCKIRMEFIGGSRVKELLNEKNYEDIAEKIGDSVAKLHERNIIHGDLTTSNMIMRSDILHLIDFGLGFFSQRVEDKAVDLHLLKEALKSTHHILAEKAWRIVLKKYESNYEGAGSVLRMLEKIEKRGRYVKK